LSSHPGFARVGEGSEDGVGVLIRVRVVALVVEASGRCDHAGRALWLLVTAAFVAVEGHHIAFGNDDIVASRRFYCGLAWRDGRSR
jgi:hypothetical protein